MNYQKLIEVQGDLVQQTKFKKMKDDLIPIIGMLLLQIVLVLYFVISWIWNLVLFLRCDFQASYKEEIIHGLGVFFFPISGITVWM